MTKRFSPLIRARDEPNTCCGACYCSKKQKRIWLFGLLTPVTILAVLVIAVIVNAAVVEDPFERKVLDLNPSFIEADEDVKYEWAKRLGDAVKIRTVSFNESYVNITAMEELNALIEKSFPAIHSASFVKHWRINGLSRLYRVEGTMDTKNPYLFSAHFDVVPEGDAKDWDHDPFLGEVVTDSGLDYLYGRGTLDNKQSVFGVLEALEHIVKSDLRPKRTFYIALGHDEEVSGHKGAGMIKHELQELLQENDEELDFILDEGSFFFQGVFPGADDPMALISVAEKGYATLDISIETEQFHSSIPPPESAVGILAKAIVAIEENRQPSLFGQGVEIETVRYAAAHVDFASKLAMANTWLFSSILSSIFGKDPKTDALQRTTSAVTVIEGGFKENVIPATARAVVNHRIHPADTLEKVKAHDVENINDDRVTVTVRSSSPASRISPYGNDAMTFQVVANSALDIYPNASVVPSLTVASTDSKHYTNLTSNVYRLCPVLLFKEDISRIHGINERISVESYNLVVEFYHRVINNADFLVVPKSDFEEGSGEPVLKTDSDDLLTDELLLEESA